MLRPTARNVAWLRSSFFVLLCSLSLGACMVSEKPLLDAENRVLPFKTPITIEVYDRKSPSEPWRMQDKAVTLVADAQLVVREQNDTERVSYTFYPFQPGRFLVQARFNDGKDAAHFAYGVLEIQNGEGLLHHLDCASIDQAAFKKAGGVVTGQSHQECQLNGLADPLGFLKSLAMQPSGSQQRHVPVR